MYPKTQALGIKHEIVLNQPGAELDRVGGCDWIALHHGYLTPNARLRLTTGTDAFQSALQLCPCGLLTTCVCVCVCVWEGRGGNSVG